MSTLKMVQSAENSMVCDVNTGICAPADLDDSGFMAPAPKADWELVYVGDPMCSSCWAIAPTVSELPKWAAEQGAKFSIISGGLRPGGGDPWDDKFRGFLRQHWIEMAELSGQPFKLGLLDREHFNYDTEPSARAVVVVRSMLGESDENAQKLTAFFQELQHRFSTAQILGVGGERQPIANATIIATPAAADLRPGVLRRPPPLPEDPAWQVAASTDDEGRFVLPDLPLGNIRLVVVAPASERLETVVRVAGQADLTLPDDVSGIAAQEPEYRESATLGSRASASGTPTRGSGAR